MKKKTKKLNAQQLVISELIKKNGGFSYVANRMAEITDKPFHKQGVSYWVNKGGVPLKYIHIVSDLWNVPPHALNFIGLQKSGVVPKKTWVQIVAECKLSKATEIEVLKLKTPK